MARIFDVFNFFTELDLLEIRLNYLQDIVDEFIICDSNFSFTGIPKSIHFDVDRFSKFNIRRACLDSVYSENPWLNDHQQRMQSFTLLEQAGVQDDDIILIGDLDEIPRLEDLWVAIQQDFRVIEFIQKMYYYYLNCYTGDNWSGTKAVRWGLLKQHNPVWLKLNPGPNQTIVHSGWHFSYLGGEQAIQEKILASSHQEWNIPEVKAKVSERLNTLEDLYGRGGQFSVVPIDESFPKYILNNQEKYSHLIKAI